jgi:hypothetical protein
MRAPPRILFLLTCLLASLLTSSLAQAHVKSESNSVWLINGKHVNLNFTLPLIEVARLSESGKTQPGNDEVLKYLSTHLSVSSKAGVCQEKTQRAVAATDQFRRFEFNYECPSDKDLQFHCSVLFEKVASHVNLAQIETANGKYIEQIINADNQTISLSSEEDEIKSAGFIKYVEMGIMHIFTGVDHMSFLLGLVLISKRTRDLVFVITGFTLGHSITLALATIGILKPDAQFIDALVALTIALIGAENIAVATHKPGAVATGVGGLLLAMTIARLLGYGTLPVMRLFGAGIFTANYLMISGHLRDAGRLRLVVTMVFGLIHGFGFAADLLQLHMPTEMLAKLLVGFNMGVEVGQLTVVFVLLSIVALLRKVKLAMPRPIVVDAIASGLVGIGLFWFIQRSF